MITSARLQRLLRKYAETELDLKWLGTEPGGRHIFCLLETPTGVRIRVPVPRGTVNESGTIVNILKTSVRQIAATADKRREAR